MLLYIILIIGQRCQSGDIRISVTLGYMKVAIVQDGPVYLNAEATLEKTLAYIHQAKDQNCDLVVFGENWFSGYPVWLDVCADANLWEDPDVREIWAQTADNGLSLESTYMDTLCKVASDTGLFLIMGANEFQATGPGNGTIYNTIFTIGPTGEILNHHRKLMPTYTEKLVHGHGDGAGLLAIDTPKGRVGSLICWEHWMPLTRQAMHDQGEDLHIALWPYAKETHQLASRHYAHEGRCFVIAVGQVLAVGQVMHVDELPSTLQLSDKVTVDENGLLLKGGSAVYGPDGATLLSPQYGKRELITIELDLSQRKQHLMNLAVSGHYQRPDVFDFKVNKNRN